MADREKVIKGLEILMNGCEYIDCDDCCFYISTKPTRCGLREEQIQEEALALLKKQEAVVRCKDCKWAEVSDNEHTWCDHVDHEFCHSNDWFCADGERKGGRGSE